MGVWKFAVVLPMASILAIMLIAPEVALPGAQNLSSSFSITDAGKYNGPGGCAASNCHGSVKPRNVPGIRISQNEFSIWAARDKHARAYSVLSNPVSMRMAKILKIDQPNKAEKCLVCHALYVKPELRATTFQLDDGVTCENCHGPAVGWLGPHTTENWKHYSAAEKSRFGMYDTLELTSRSERCMSCHVGNAQKQVDHEMIAAGHPDLTFELDSFTAAMPRHWNLKADENPWIGTQSWVIGQAVQLRESLKRLSFRAGGPNWPDYAELDCFACHHALTTPSDSWRLTTTDYYQGRRAGVPAWNASRYIVFRSFVGVIDSLHAQQLDSSLTQLSTLIAQWGNPKEIADTATNAAKITDDLLQRVRAQQYSADLTARIMLAISSNANAIANGGERAAEQATMALDTLSIAYSANTKLPNDQELRAQIGKLFQQLQNPSAYNAPQFEQQLQKVQALLPHASAVATGAE